MCFFRSGEMDEATLAKDKPFLGVPFTTKDCFKVKGKAIIFFNPFFVLIKNENMICFNHYGLNKWKNYYVKFYVFYQNYHLKQLNWIIYKVNIVLCIKDLVNNWNYVNGNKILFDILSGLKQTAGLYSRRNFVSESDADTVRLMSEAGGIPLCVTNVSELCLWWESSNYVYGRTNNPYNTSRIVGGSSGGEVCSFDFSFWYFDKQ